MENGTTEIPYGFPTSKLADIFKKIAERKELTLVDWTPFELASNLGNLMGESSGGDKEALPCKLVGLFAFQLRCLERGSKGEEMVRVVLKSKPPEEQYHARSNGICEKVSETLAEKFRACGILGLGFSNAPMREVLFSKFSMEYPSFKKISAEILHTEADEQNGVYAVFLEHLDSDKFFMLHELDPTRWTTHCMHTVLSDIAEFHSHNMINLDAILERADLRDLVDQRAPCLLSALPLWKEMLDINHRLYPEFFTKENTAILHNFIDNYENIVMKRYEKYPKTLIHSDFYPGNICFRTNPREEDSTTCVIDWETVALHIPQRDLVLFFLSTLPVEASMSTWREVLEFYRLKVKELVGKVNEELARMATDKERFHEMFDFALMEVMVERIAWLGVVKTQCPISNHTGMCQKGFKYLAEIVDKYPFLRCN